MSNFSSYPDIVGMSELRKSSSQLSTLVAASGLITGRYYFNIDTNTLYRADAENDLGKPFVRGTSAVDDLATQLNNHIGNYNTFAQNTNDALADRPTLSASDGRYLGITAQAVDSAKFDGKTYSTVTGAWQSDIATAANQINAALSGKVSEIGGIQLSNAATVTFANLVKNSSINKEISEIEDGKVQVFLTFTQPTHGAGITMPNGSEQAVSNGDSFVFKVASGAISGPVTFINNLDNLKFSAMDASISQVNNDITTLMARTDNGNATSIDANGILGFGGTLLRDTVVEGGKAVHYKNTINVFNALALQCVDDATKFVRIAGAADGGLRYGLVSFTPFT
jgi:hypothetical protein